MKSWSQISFIVALVILIAGGTIYYYLTAQNPLNAYIGKPIPPSLYEQLEQLSEQGYNVSVTVNDFQPLPLNFSSNGKPAVIFIGDEWCPYCGAERWALIIALLRFGNFSNLSYMLSSPTDVYPDTPTFSFYHAKYTSKYIAFIGIENENREYELLEQVPPSIYTVWQKYGNLSVPFIIIGSYYQVGTTIDPGLLSGYNWSYVIAQLHNASSPIYKEIYEQANLITKMICQVDGGQPASVCSHFEQQNNQPLEITEMQKQEE